MDKINWKISHMNNDFANQQNKPNFTNIKPKHTYY